MNDLAVTIHLKADDIKSELVSAVEGGINYWCKMVFPTHEVEDVEFYDFPLTEGSSWTLIEEEGEVEHILNREKLERGLALMLEKVPHHFADLINGSGDVVTADVLVQLAVFREIKYS